MNDTEKILTTISEHLGISHQNLTSNSHLRDDLNAEDLEIADLLMKLESQFQITISKEEAQNIHTVADIIELFK